MTDDKKRKRAAKPPPSSDDDDSADALFGILHEAIVAPQKRARKRAAANPAAATYDSEHARYYRGISKAKRQKITELERGVIEAMSGEGAVPRRFRLLEADLPPHVKAIVMARVDVLFRNDAVPAEKAKMSKWLDAFLRLPFGKTVPLPVNHLSPTDAVQRFVASTRDRLDAKVYGHADAKKQIIRTLAKWISNPASRGAVIGIQGPMGCGKTTLAKKCIAEALGLPMVMIPLGGVTDSSVLTGHLYTYEGSTYGAVANCLMGARCMNPVILLDELDKAGNDGRGQEVYNTLIHMTDPVQNEHVVDNYFADVPLDLSRALMVFTFNRAEAIEPILRDRMTIISASGYSGADKREIAKNYLLPNILSQYGMVPGDVVLSDDAVDEIVLRVDEEQGVRNLERALETVVGNINLTRILEGSRAPASITRETVAENVGNARADLCSISHIYL